MTTHYEDLIDRYNFGQLSQEEQEMFNLSLEYNAQLRKEFIIYLKMKYFLLDGHMAKMRKFLAANKIVLE